MAIASSRGRIAAGLVLLGALVATFVGVWATADNAAATPEATIRSKLESARPGLAILRVVPAEVSGMYRVELASGEMLHVTADAKYFFGDLWTIHENDLVNLSERRRDDLRRDMLAAVPERDMVVFAPAQGTKAVVTVFTDVDCGYCQKLHSEMAEYNALGIEIRYLAYPRAGLDSESARKLVTAWCSSDRQAALTRLKRRESVPQRTCTNPVAREFELGQRMGVNGTPALVLQDGRMLAGYLPPEQLAAVLGIAPHG